MARANELGTERRVETVYSPTELTEGRGGLIFPTLAALQL